MEACLLAEVLTGVNGNIIKWAREYYNMKTDYAKLRKVSEVFRKLIAVLILPELPTYQGKLKDIIK